MAPFTTSLVVCLLLVGNLAAEAAMAQGALPTSPQGVVVQTSDDIALEGAWREGGSWPEIGVLLVHGLGGRHDAPPLSLLAEQLARRGYSTLSLNMRDHGAVRYWSLFEETVLDIQAGVEFLKAAGVERIVVLGHSLGASCVTFYRSQLRDEAVQGLVLLAPVGNAHDALLAIGGPSAEAALAEAARRVASAEGLEEPMLVPAGRLGTFWATPASLLSYAGPDTMSDPLRWLPEIELPILVVHATEDALSDIQQPVELRDVAQASARADLVLLDGADHGFTRVTEQLSRLLDVWIQQALECCVGVARSG